MLFVLALILVAGVMAVSVKKRSPQSAVLIFFLWLCAGLLMKPWTFFTNPASTIIPVDEYWAPCFKIAAIVWVVSLVLSFVLLVSILAAKKSRRRRRRSSQRDGQGSGAQRTESRRRGTEVRLVEDDEPREEYYDDSYEV